MTKKNFRLVTVSFFAVFISLVAILFLALNISQTTALKSSARRAQSDAVLSITSVSKNQVRQGNIPPISISLAPLKPQNISTISLRLTFSYRGYPKPSILAPVINPNLLSSNWSFAVNSVSYDDANQIATIDMAGLNLNTSGYNLQSAINIATINFGADSPLTFAPVFQFNSSLTSVIAKDGTPLKLSFAY
jgi:hypothetical protein